MGSFRIVSFLALSGTALCLLAMGLTFKQAAFDDSLLLVQNTNSYLGPITPVPGSPQLVRVQVLVYDSPEADGLQIQNVKFYEHSIPLKPRDIYGFRGQASFQIPPGKYKLAWVVRRDRIIWPRTISHEEEVAISPRDLWLQIEITGEEAKIL